MSFTDWINRAGKTIGEISAVGLIAGGALFGAPLIAGAGAVIGVGVGAKEAIDYFTESKKIEVDRLNAEANRDKSSTFLDDLERLFAQFKVPLLVVGGLVGAYFLVTGVKK